MRTLIFLLLIDVAIGQSLVLNEELGLQIEEGNRVSLFAGHDLAPDIYSMTTGPEGEVVVSGKGYVRFLRDTDGDGIADSAVDFATPKEGGMGMCFDGDDLLYTGADGKFVRYRDADGNRKADGEPELIKKFGGGEHGIHAIRKGADGLIYLIGGNNANIPGAEAGAIISYSPPFSGFAVVAQGFRNPYDFDFTPEGEIITYDSDCEREAFLPWYTPTRLYHVYYGRHHGWRLGGHLRSWDRPGYYCDSVPWLADIGRGSPTGVLCANGGVFFLDWTFGKVWFAELTVTGHTYKAEPRVFMESVGTNGFAPTDIVAGGDGALYISMGGRGTKGSVFRIEPAVSVAASIQLDVFERCFPLSRVGIMRRQSLRTMESQPDIIFFPDIVEKCLPLESMEQVRLFMRALGDWNLKKPSRESFTGYELGDDSIFEQGYASLLKKCQDAVGERFPTGYMLMDRELARLCAMLRVDEGAAMIEMMTVESDATEDFHYLACLARSGARLTDAQSQGVAKAIVALDGKLKGAQHRSKQTYSDRLNEVIAAFPDSVKLAMSKEDAFYTPGNVPLSGVMKGDASKTAARGFLKAITQSPEKRWPGLVIDLIHKALPSSDIREPLKALALADTRHIESVAKLLRGDPKDVDAPFLKKADELTWEPVAEGKGDTAAAIATMKKLSDADWNSGDVTRGRALFVQRSCIACHGSENAVGPDLAGVASRFSPQDLFVEILKPNRNIQPAYASTVIKMRDGSVFVGQIAFRSADGLMVQVSAAETIRLDEKDIISETSSKSSLMPAGLLSGLDRQGFADMYAYLRTL